MINGYIDFRSDTVTHPTPAMRRAMAEAEVGDDVWGDDRTVKRLEQMSAERMGHEAGLFVASGTMGNIVALLTHCRRGEEVIAGDRSHIVTEEQGGMAALGGLMAHPISTRPDGRLDLEDIQGALRGDDPHWARTRLICIENTQNQAGGIPLDPNYMRSVAALARRNGLKLHVDGARIFNAAVALGVPADALTRDADSVMFCLSKGLSAPIGSVLCGSKEFIAEAYRSRKVVGGAMRQVGVLAAAGIVALETMVDRLAEDHANARRLAEGLSDTPGFEVELERVRTNMVYFDLASDVSIDGQEVERRMASRGVRVAAVSPRRFRAVTHAWVTADEVDRALLAFRAVLTDRS